MVYFNIVVALVWMVTCFSMAIGWWLDLPVGPGEKFTLAYAMAFLLVKFIADAVASWEAQVIRRHRHLDRRPQL